MLDVLNSVNPLRICVVYAVIMKMMKSVLTEKSIEIHLNT